MVNIESLRDRNQAYREMLDSRMQILWVMRDHSTRQGLHWQIIGMMILIASISVLLPTYLSELIVFEHFITILIVVIVISIILLCSEYFIYNSLLDDYLLEHSQSVTHLQDFRLAITDYTDLKPEHYEKLSMFQYQLYLASIVLITEKKLNLAENWRYILQKKFRSSIKKERDEILLIAKKNLNTVFDLKVLSLFDENAVDKFTQRIHSANRLIKIHEH